MTTTAVTAAARRGRVRRGAGRAGSDRRPAAPAARGSCRRRPWSPTCSAARRATSRSRPSTSARAGSIEVAVATLATDRALLLLGVPGTAKTWVSEHLAAAISGDSTLLVQGTAGTAEEAIRYGWNYAQLIAEGPSRGRAGRRVRCSARWPTAKIARIEELTRMPSDVQDALITILSEKTLPIPELDDGSPGPQGLQRHRHRQRSRQGRQRAVERVAAALQHGRAAAAGRRRGRGRDRLAPGRAARCVARAAAAGRRAGRDPPGRDGVPRAALRADRGRPDHGQVARPARCRRPRRSASSPVDSRWRRTSATASCARMMLPAASSARS